VQKVLWTCAELELSPERRIVGGPYGGTDTPEFGALNPNRTVPVWQDGKTVLWESQAIMRHLARRHGALYGRTEPEMAVVDCWLDWFALAFWPPVRLLFVDVFTTGEIRIEDAPAQAALLRLTQTLAIAEHRVAWHGHLAVADFSIADIALAIGLNRLWGLAYEVAGPRSLEAWLAAQADRSGFGVATAEEPDLPGRAKRGAS